MNISETEDEDKDITKTNREPGSVEYTFNPSTPETEAGGAWGV